MAYNRKVISILEQELKVLAVFISVCEGKGQTAGMRDVMGLKS
jgi:hypothetical protein